MQHVAFTVRPGGRRSSERSMAPAAGAGAPTASRHWAALLARGIALLALTFAPLAAAFNPGADSEVSSIAVQPDGRVLLAGTFQSVDNTPRNRVARVAANGSIDTAFPQIATVNRPVVAVQPDGKILIAGGGQAGAGGVRRLNADGSNDNGFTDAFTTGEGIENRIRVVTVQQDGKILLGGGFTSVGGVPRAHLARLNADGSLDTGFDPGINTPAEVWAVAVQADGRVVIGGQNYFVRLLANGSADPAVLPDQPANITSGLAVQPDGRILIGGWNPLVLHGTTYGRLVRMNVDGSVDATFHPSPSIEGVSQIALRSDGGIVVLQQTSDAPILRLRPDGSAAPDFRNVTADSGVGVMALQADGKVLFGGTFSNVNGLWRGRVARVHPDGRLDNGASGPLTVTSTATNGSISPGGGQPVLEGATTSFTLTPDPGHVIASVTGCGGTRLENVYTTGYVWNDCTVVATFVDASDAVFDPDADGNVHAIEVLGDGDIVVGGTFSRIGYLARQRLAKLDPADGSADPSYTDFFEAGIVTAIARNSDGSALVGTHNGRLRRVLADGSVDAGFNPVFSEASINAIAIQPDGKIVVGGDFTSVNDTMLFRIARLNADGSLDSGFMMPFDGADSAVNTILLEPDGRIVIGGQFFTFSGWEQQGLARLNADGSYDSSFPAARANVLSVIRDEQGRYLIGAEGPIDLNDGAANSSRLIRMLPNGTRDVGFEASVGRPVMSIREQADGKVLIGGDFTAVNEQPRSRLARLNTNGTLEAAFDTVVNARVLSIALQADGRILIGGAFVSVDGYARRGIARLTADGEVDVSAFTVTPHAGPNGTISPNVPQTVDPGATAAFTVVPDAGYVIGNVSGCGGALDGLVYTTGPITAHCTVTAAFLMDSVSYTVTPVSGDNGALSPATPQSVLFAQTTSFDVVPAPGYFIDTIEGCDGSLAGSTFTTGRILGDCTVTASFSSPSTIEIVAGSNQMTAAGTGFARPLQVRVLSGNSAPVAGVEVTFAAPASGAGAILAATSAISDGDGIARVAARANQVGGAYAVVASVGSLDATFDLRNEALDHGGVEFEVTVGTAPGNACGSESAIEAIAGAQLNYCFRMTNRSDVTLNHHTLTMATFGHASQYHLTSSDRFFHALERPLAPGETWQYNRMITVGNSDQTPHFTWTATATAPAYDVEDHSGVAFLDISDIGTRIPTLGTFAGHDLVELPFPLYLYGQTFLPDGIGRLCINRSGTLQLQRGAGDESCAQPFFPFLVPAFMGENGPLPQSIDTYTRRTNLLLPYWDALGDNGAIFHHVIGNAPNRRFIVQWQDKDHFLYPSPTHGITFQAVIEEHTGRFHFVYETVNFDVVATPSPDAGNSATIGLVGHAELGQGVPPYLQHSYNSPVIEAGQSITLTPTDVPRHASAQVFVDVGAPALTLAPPSIAAHAAPGGSVSRSLTVGNIGDMALEWSMDAAAARSHFPPAGVAYTKPSQANETHVWHVPLAAPPSPAGWFEPELFEVPAWGFAWESGYLYPVSFDAADPQQLVPRVGPAAYGAIYAGDFVDNDFGRLYMLHGEPDSDFSFSTYDVADDSFTLIAAGPNVVSPEAPFLPPYHRWAGMAWDPARGTLYASTTGGYFCGEGQASDLYTLDPAIGAPTRVGPIDAGGPVCVADIAVAPDGAMYGIDTLGDALLAIDKATGSAAVIGWLGFSLIDNGPHAIDFDDASGTLYLAAGYTEGRTGGVFSIDRVTGLASLVGPFPVEPVAGTFSFLALPGFSIATIGGECVDPADVPWLAVNQVAGVLAPGGQAQLDVRLDAGSLAEGEYTAQLCVFSNDRSHALARVPVQFTVSDVPPTNDVFADGFE